MTYLFNISLLRWFMNTHPLCDVTERPAYSLNPIEVRPITSQRKRQIIIWQTQNY
jgi:hypothetical protein